MIYLSTNWLLFYCDLSNTIYFTHLIYYYHYHYHYLLGISELLGSSPWAAAIFCGLLYHQKSFIYNRNRVNKYHILTSYKIRHFIIEKYKMKSNLQNNKSIKIFFWFGYCCCCCYYHNTHRQRTEITEWWKNG